MSSMSIMRFVNKNSRNCTKEVYQNVIKVQTRETRYSRQLADLRQVSDLVVAR